MTQKRFLTVFANLAATSDQEQPREFTNIYCIVAPIIDTDSINEQMIPFQGRVPGR